jgi:acyl-CoA synthetase (AMP-forming)/AMP-acid ligase II
MMIGYHHSWWRGQSPSIYPPVLFPYASTERQNLFPIQIENALTAHPGISEGAAVAVPNPTYGEVVGAWIVREPGVGVQREEVRNAVSEKMSAQVGLAVTEHSPVGVLSDMVLTRDVAVAECTSMGVVYRG